MRDGLIELLKCFRTPICEGLSAKLPDVERLADHLLANGVIVLPCKIGDTVYQTDGVILYSSKVNRILVLDGLTIYQTSAIDFDDRAIGKTVFLTREEAEKALAQREGE